MNAPYQNKIRSKIKKNKLFFPILFFSLFFLSILLTFAQKYLHTRSDSFLFQSYTAGLFAEQMKADTLSMHYTIANPSDFHIPSYEVTLPDFHKSDYLNQNVSLENQLHILDSISAEQLSDTDALCYELLSASLKNQLEGQHYYFYSEPLSPNSGVTSQLPILLAEYYFLSEQDVKDYLALLACIPSYFSSIEDYEALKSQAGLFMPSYSSRKLMEQCSSIITEEDVKNHTHFLVTTFQERLEKLQSSSDISPDKLSLYQAQNEQLLLEAVLPAYKKLSSAIASLRSSSKNENGLCYLPKGRDYYEYLLKQTTGTSKSIAAIKELLQQRLREDYTLLLSLRDSLKQEAFHGTFTFPLENPELMLQDLENRVQEDFPSFPTTTPAPSYSIKKVSPSLADYVSPAFYLTPPIDHMSENSIYINEQSIPDELELYTTLAHEGYPGHLYQTLYFQQSQPPQTHNPIRSLLYYGGYIEGWALYTENHSYEYAKKLLQENDPTNADYYDILIDAYRCQRDLQLCMYSILDIAIHYDGFQYEEVFSMLAEFGIVNETATRSIYEYIVEEPANYLKYYLGYLEILELKTTVKKKMGPSYSDRDFHRFMLESGPMDFPTLRSLLQKKYKQSALTAYISSKNEFNFVRTFSNTFFSSSVSFSVAWEIIFS